MFPLFSAYLLVRMMNFFLGQNTLLEGVKNYIRNFRFKVTNLNNLWTLFPLEKEKHEILKIDSTLEDIMDSWTSKAGYAHIKLTRVTDSNMMKIEQVSYCLNTMKPVALDFTLFFKVHTCIPLHFLNISLVHPYTRILSTFRFHNLVTRTRVI